MKNVHTLNLNGCKQVTDISMLGNVHKLLIYQYRNGSDMQIIDFISDVDVSTLHNICIL